MNNTEDETPPLAEPPCSGFVACNGCGDEMCEEIGQCFANIYPEAQEVENAYIIDGKCSDCGACSLKDAETKCKPRALGDTADASRTDDAER